MSTTTWRPKGRFATVIMQRGACSIFQTYEPEMSNGRMDSVGYLLMTWVDPRLAFRPGNVSGIRMETSKIWTPDVELYTA